MNSSFVNNKVKMNLRDSLLVYAILVFLLLVALTLYTLAHEGGHALVGLLFGGKITVFSANFFNLSAHVGIDGEFTPGQQALISVAGITLPLLLSLAFILFAPQKGDVVFRWFKMILFIVPVNSLLAWIVIPVLVWMGITVGDDSANFLGYTHLPPLLVTIAALLVYLTCWMVFFYLAGGPRKFLTELRDNQSSGLKLSETLRTVLTIAVIGGASMAASFGLTMAYPDKGFEAPAGYELAAEVNLSKQAYSDQSVYQLQLVQPSTVSFFIALNNVKGAPVRIELTGTNGYTNTFLSNDGPKFDAGHASVHPKGIALESGTYQVRLTFQQCQGNVLIYTQIE